MSQAEPCVTGAPRRRPTREEVRERLIEGARKAFSVKGFSGASIDYICTQAGFSRGAFYSNFADKDALFFALYDRRIDRLYSRVSTLTDLAQSAENPLQRISELLREPDAEEVEWDILNKEFIVHALRNDAAREKLLASRQESRRRLSVILTQLEPRLGDHPDLLDQLCRFAIALHEGELTQLGLEPAVASSPSLMAEFIPSALRHTIDRITRRDM